MEPINRALRGDFLPSLFRGKKVKNEINEILGHSMNRGGFRKPELRRLAKESHGNSIYICRELVSSQLKGMDLNYVVHWACARKSITEVWEERYHEETAALYWWNNEVVM